MDKKHYDLWKKACGNLCRGQKKKYDSHMKVDIVPLNPRMLPVVLASTKTFSVGITKVIMKKLLVHRDLSFLS